jgi:ABC-type antimicrobial peptide transport system permease subunit
MFLCQAILMNGLALLPGGLMGAALAYIIAICFRQMFGHNVYFALHPNLFGGYLAIATLLVLAVALLPAVRTMRLKPLEAIHAE